MKKNCIGFLVFTVFVALIVSLCACASGSANAETPSAVPQFSRVSAPTESMDSANSDNSQMSGRVPQTSTTYIENASATVKVDGKEQQIKCRLYENDNKILATPLAVENWTEGAKTVQFSFDKQVKKITDAKTFTSTILPSPEIDGKTLLVEINQLSEQKEIDVTNENGIASCSVDHANCNKIYVFLNVEFDDGVLGQYCICLTI